MAMTEAEKITTVRVLVENDPDATDATIAVYLKLACKAMMKRLYALFPDKMDGELPACYEMDQCELAARYFLRRGGQGEINHEENGVNRQYASVDDADILNRLTPYAKVGG